MLRYTFLVFYGTINYGLTSKDKMYGKSFNAFTGIWAGYGLYRRFND